MKNKLFIVLVIITLTACKKDPIEESIVTPAVTKEQQEESAIKTPGEDVIYFGKEETGFLKLGDVPVICELDSKEKSVLCSKEQIQIVGEWIQPVETENYPDNIYLGNLKNKNKVNTYFFVERSDEVGVNRWVSVFSYENKNLIEIGTIEGLISDSFPSGQIEKKNNDKIVTNGYIIGTIQQSYIQVEYQLLDGKVELVKQDFYDILNQEQQDITLLEELVVYEEPDIHSKQFKMQPQKVHLVRSDGIEWMEIVAQDGTKGYARADGFTMLDMDNRTSTDIFDGLAYWG